MGDGTLGVQTSKTQCIENINTLIHQLSRGTKRWSPKLGAVLDRGLTLKDPTSRMTMSQSCPCVFMLGISTGSRSRKLFGVKSEVYLVPQTAEVPRSIFLF